MSELRHGSVRDCNIDYNLKHDFIWADRYALNTTTLATQGPLSAGFSIGSRPFVVMSNTSMGAISMVALNNGVTIPWMAYDIDNRHPVYVRHLWTTRNANATDAVRFTTRFQSLTTASAIQTATVPLTVRIGTSTKGIAQAFGPTWTGWGVIGTLTAGILSGQIFPNDTYGILWDTQMESTNKTPTEMAKAGNDFLYVATEIAYTPKQTFGDGSRREARYLESPLSFKEAGPSQDLP